MNKYRSIIICSALLFCQYIAAEPNQHKVISSDIDLFWQAFDQVSKETNPQLQAKLLNKLYIQPGSEGLKKIIEVKGYTPEQYVELFNKHPKFWRSIRANTYKAHTLSSKLNEGVARFVKLYPQARPANIYFTIGAMMTNGTTQGDSVLIGSELAMADTNTDTSEFKGKRKQGLESFFATNPIDGVVLLNVHEFVHTQQKPIQQELLYQVLYEGVAEYLSVLAMSLPSNTPAVEYGKNNPEVKRVFEQQMFYNRTFEWLWSNSSNQFNTRDLGYYIGYAIAELYYQKANNKAEAIRTLVELDYTDANTVDALIDSTGFFSKPLAQLRKEDLAKRPKIASIEGLGSDLQQVSPDTSTIKINFASKLNGYNTGLNYADKGPKAYPDIVNVEWATDSRSWTMEVALKPNTEYQFYITNFRNEQGVPVAPYLVEFKTSQ